MLYVCVCACERCYLGMAQDDQPYPRCDFCGPSGHVCRVPSKWLVFVGPNLPVTTNLEALNHPKFAHWHVEVHVWWRYIVHEESNSC